jgi:hypothetical protein
MSEQVGLKKKPANSVEYEEIEVKSQSKNLDIYVGFQSQEVTESRPKGDESGKGKTKEMMPKPIFKKPPEVSLSALDVKTSLPEITKAGFRGIRLNLVKPPTISVKNLDLSSNLDIIPAIKKYLPKLVFNKIPTVSTQKLDLTGVDITSLYYSTKKIWPRLPFPKKPNVIFTSLNTETIVDVSHKEPTSEVKEPNDELKEYNDVIEEIDKGIGPFSYITPNDSIIIVYDENKAGVEDSLQAIANEILKNHGLSLPNVVVIKQFEQLEQYIKQIGTMTKLFVLGNELCIKEKDKDEDKEIKEEIVNTIQSTIKGIIGTSCVILMPSCLYNKLFHFIGGKANLVLVDSDINIEGVKTTFKASKNIIETMAYGASGLTFKNWPGYGSLGNYKNSFYNLLRRATKELEDIVMEAKNPELLLKIFNVQGGDEHKKLENLAILYLVKEKNAKLEDIHIEEELNGKRPDIRWSNVIIDVKTSVGSDGNPIIPPIEMIDVVDKYHNNADEIWVVFRPLPLLIYLKKVIEVRKALIMKYKKKIEVMVPAEKDGKITLLTLKEFLKELKEYYKKVVNKSLGSEIQRSLV